MLVPNNSPSPAPCPPPLRHRFAYPLLATAWVVFGVDYVSAAQDDAAPQSAAPAANQATQAESDKPRERPNPTVPDELSTDIERWLGEVQTLQERGDLAGAREHLSPLVTSEVYAALLANPDTIVMQGLDAIDAAAKQLSLIEVLSVVREERVRRLSASLGPDDLNLLGAEFNLALTRNALGDIAGAFELQQVVHAAWERLLPPDHLNLLTAKLGLASTLKALGDIAAALELQQVVHAAWERLLPPDHPNLLNAKLNLASTLKALGDIAAAHELQQDVHAVWEQQLPPDHPDLLRAKLNLASTSKALGDLAGALELQQVVHTAWERLLPPDHPHLLTAKSNLAATRYALGDIAGALELQQFVHTAQRRLLPPEHPDLLLAKSNLAATRYVLGDLAGALELQQVVHATRERLLPADHPDLLTAKQNLAGTRYVLGDLDAALELQETILRGQILRAQVLRRDAPRVARASALKELHRLFRCLSLSESITSRGGVGIDPKLFSTLESLRSVSVGSPVVMRAAAKRPALARLLDERRRVRGELSDWQLSAPGVEAEVAAVETWRSELVRLSEERDSLERSTRRELANAGFASPLPTAASVAKRLTADDVLIDFLRYDRYGARDPETGRRAPTIDSMLAFVVTHDKKVRRVELGPSDELEQLVTEWRARLGQPIGRGVGSALEGRSDTEAAAALRERLLDPCLAAVEGEFTGELYVILDDFLHLAPIEALVTEDGRRLGEVCVVHNEVSAQRLATNAPTYTGAGILLALGGVDYDADDVKAPRQAILAAAPPTGDSYRSSRSSRPGNFNSLSQTRLEVETLDSLFEELAGGESVILTRAKASKQALFERAPEARYLHLATHGWFAPETFRSTIDSLGERGADVFASFGRAETTVRGFAPETLCGLALAGANKGMNSDGKVLGLLTAEELGALDLANCELAVLSACETNVGLRRAGQGIQSLQTALHAAGARAAITTLWRVDDAAARRLMELFYTKLWRDGAGKADALWQAKMALRDEGYGVRDWAAWVLTGDPR